MVYLQDLQSDLKVWVYRHIFVWLPLLLSFLEKVSVSISTGQHETHEQLQHINFVLEYPGY